MKRYNITTKEKILSNGLQVVLVHKPGYYHSLFMLATSAGGFDHQQIIDGKIKTYRTGSAHYLEHQMFRLHGKDVTDIFADYQASTNAFTTFNKTAYYFQTTAAIEKPLNLLMDFVEELDIDEESVNKEKGIILSEYDMYQQQPEQRLLKETWNSLYEKHPIHIDVLGTREDIQAMCVEDLKAFYHYNYDPSRLILVGVTGNDLDDTMAMIEVNQSKHPSQITQKVMRYIPDERMAVKRTSFSCEMDITTPYVCIGYKLPPAKTVEEALRNDLAIQLRLESLMSLLNPDYQKWLDDRIITGVAGAESDIAMDHANILFFAQTNKVDEYIQLVKEVIQKMASPMDEKIYQSLRNRTIAENIRVLDHFENMAVDMIEAKINQYSYWESLDLMNDLRIDDIQHICAQIDFSYETITTIYPKASK